MLWSNRLGRVVQDLPSKTNLPQGRAAARLGLLLLSRMTMRWVAISLLLSALAAAQLLPEALGPFERQTPEAIQPAERDIFGEFGFEQGEKARYVAADGQAIEISALRFSDDTGALAAYQWSQTSDGKPVEYGERAWRNGNQTFIQFGNYLVQMSGATPLDEHVEWMLAYLPRVQLTPDPPVLRYVPADGLIPHSQRHVLGPAALERLAPEVPPSVAAFRFGTEAQFARYQSSAGELRLALFSYPSAQIARAQLEEFGKVSALVAKRSGSIIAVVIAPPSPDEAERLLAKVRDAVEITLTPQQENRHDNLVTLLIDIIIMCLILAGLGIIGGVLVAGLRILATRYAPDSIFASSEEGSIIKLNIDAR